MENIYTESEVKDLCWKLLNSFTNTEHLIDSKNGYESDFKIWFDQNRKSDAEMMEDFEIATYPAIEYLFKYHNPMTKIFIDYDRAELLSGEKCYNRSSEVPD